MNFWRGKRVAITGAGGTVGSHLAERLACDTDLLLLDNSELALWGLSFPNGVKRFADVRDGNHLTALFMKFMPDVVFHAAALKHVPICEANPSEVRKTNIDGTSNVATAAQHCRARAILISTDKAADAVSVMGASKRLAEVIMADAGFAAVRFHNVFGSSGSVVDLFAKQIAKGGPVTVTHPDMVRWFSAPQDACELLLRCAEHAPGPDGRSLYALEVGKPMQIVDLAQAMIAQALVNQPYKDIKIKVVGMRPGERLEEKLIADGERRVDVGIDGIFAIERAESRRSAGDSARGAQGIAEERTSESEAARALPLRVG